MFLGDKHKQILLFKDYQLWTTESHFETGMMHKDNLYVTW
jgi:hypothetical protein